MTINIYNETTIFDELHDEWLELAKQTQFPQPFSTPTFLKTWWEVFGNGDLKLITIRHNQDQLTAVLPLTTDAVGVTRLLGHSDLFDYADFLVDQTLNVVEIMPKFQAALSQIHLSTFEFSSLSKFSWLFQHAPTLFENERVTTLQQTVCPQLTLPSTWEEYLQNLDRKQRQEIRRKMKKTFTEFTAEYELLTDPAQLNEAIADFIRLHQLSSPSKAEFWTDQNTQFFQRLLPRLFQDNILKLYFLKVENHRVATMLVFDFADTYFLYNSGFDPHQYSQLGTGNVLTAYTLQQAIEQKKKTYDFLSGDEEYKFRFGATAQPTFTLTNQIHPSAKEPLSE